MALAVRPALFPMWKCPDWATDQWMDRVHMASV